MGSSRGWGRVVVGGFRDDRAEVRSASIGGGFVGLGSLAVGVVDEARRELELELELGCRGASCFRACEVWVAMRRGESVGLLLRWTRARRSPALTAIGNAVEFEICRETMTEFSSYY